MSVLTIAIAALIILGGGVRAPVFAGASTDVTLDTFRSNNAEATTLGPVLENGQDYRVTVVGTFNKSAAGQWKDPPCGGTPESGPMFPSPGTINGQVGRDAEWKFAVEEGSSDCVSPHPEFRISVDAGASFQSVPAEDIGSAPDPEHKYHYTVTGQGQIVGFLLNDSTGTNNNYGVLRITVSAPIVHGVEFTQAIQQLQTIEELQADLEGDGKPPVPIVAGKPAVMRVYFASVSAVREVVVDTNLTADDQRFTLDTECTPQDRRRNDNNCLSVDFYFTPPAGNWTAELFVKDAVSGEVIEEYEFNLTSEQSNTLTIEAVETCHNEIEPGVWQCGDPAFFHDYANFLRAIAPTHQVSVIQSGHVVAEQEGSNADAWWSTVLSQLDLLHANYFIASPSFDDERLFFGAVKAKGANGPGGPLGQAYRPGHAGATRETTVTLGETDSAETLAHEVAHSLGVNHTNTGLPVGATRPGCYAVAEGIGGEDWPYPDNFLYSGPAPGTLETGFNEATGIPRPGDEWLDISSYCGPQWVSQRTYLQMLQRLNPPGIPAAAVQGTSTTGDFWLISGALDGAVDFGPLYEFETTGPTDDGAGSHRIEVRGPGDAVLFTRHFELAIGGTKAAPGEDDVEVTPVFSDLIPVQPGAAAIVVLDGASQEIGRITLAGAAPSVEITLPAQFTGTQPLSWAITDADSTDHASWVEYSADGGATWSALGTSLTGSMLVVDFGKLAGSEGQSMFRVTASDGVNSGSATSNTFTVAGKTPQANITGPDGVSFRLGQLVWLEAAAFDADDGTLDDGAVTWSSSLDGALGNGADLPWYDLSVGSHTITMTAKDSDNNEVTDTVNVTVFDAPIIEGVAIEDIDCSGAVDVLDGLALLLHLAGLDAGSCSIIGSGAPIAFGDADCDGIIGPGDVVAVLALVADLPRGCA